MDAPSELTDLREQIAALDRELLDALNRRLELVAQVQEHKHATGTRLIDAKREAELLQQLAAANDGPLSERAVHSLFTAVLDVMKQELQGEPRHDDASPSARRCRRRIATVAVIGTGSSGRRSRWRRNAPGSAAVQGWDTDSATLRESAGAGAIDRAAASLADAVAGADLVVVAVPVGAWSQRCRTCSRRRPPTRR